MDESGIGVVGGIVYLAVIVLLIASVWKVFVKAGKPGWAAIIPIYNAIVLLEIVGKPVWWIILLFIPFVNIIIAIIVYHQLSLSFGQGVGFTIGLLLLGVVFLPILGFGDAKYLGPGGAGAPAAAAPSAPEPAAPAPAPEPATPAPAPEPPAASEPEDESGGDEESGSSEEDEPEKTDI